MDVKVTVAEWSLAGWTETPGMAELLEPHSDPSLLHPCPSKAQPRPPSGAGSLCARGSAASRTAEMDLDMVWRQPMSACLLG